MNFKIGDHELPRFNPTIGEEDIIFNNLEVD